VALTMAWRFVPETRDREPGRIDWIGIVLGALALALVSFGIIQGEQSGYFTWWIDLSFGLSALFAFLFVFNEHRAHQPILDLSLFRKGPFSASVFVAFAAYFGTFSIFFFTALYLQVVVDASAFATAVTFLPMAAGLILASVFTGPWVARQGPRTPMTVGCVLAAAGILITSRVLSPHVDLPTLGWVLAIAGVGFGIMLVPVTSTPLAVVPPEHSGMAASVTNTSREMGAVFGVAVLGSIVNSKLTGELAARLKALGVPPNFQSLVLNAVKNGGGGLHSGAASSAEHSKSAAVAKLANEVINAAYEAFGSGLHVALDISGGLLLAGAVASAVLVHGRNRVTPGQSG
jgi:predicted MFS family arabinose efflux permease